MVNRWDAMASELDKLRSSIDQLGKIEIPDVPDNSAALNDLTARIENLEQEDASNKERLG